MRKLTLALVMATAAMAFVALYPPPVVGEAFKSGSHEIYFSPAGGAEDAVVKEIRAAKKSVEVAIFTCTNRDIVDILRQQAQNGVQVRVLADAFEADRSYSRIDVLEKHDAVQVRRYQPPGGGASAGERAKMHHKFCVVDGKVVLTGSFNYSRIADTHNCENLVVVREKRVAAAFRKEFERLWKLAAD